MKAADMCCARSFVVPFATADCWGRRNHFCIRMVHAVRDLMKDAYPELIETADRVAKIIMAEETRFAHTLGLGCLSKMSDDLD